MNNYKYPESTLAHRWCIGSGIEIGAAAHNPFGLDTINIDNCVGYSVYTKEQMDWCGEVVPVDIICEGNDLPFEDDSTDFIINSHVLEHFADPIGALLEWYRVIRPGGVIFTIVPHKDRTFDKGRESTTLDWLIQAHELGYAPDNSWKWHHPWTPSDICDLLDYMSPMVDWELVEMTDPDDKAGNGFSFVLLKK